MRVQSNGMVTARIFGADYWLDEICCVAQNESREMAENVALQIQFRSKGFSVLQTNYVVQFVLHPCPKAQMFTPVKGNTQRRGKKPAAVVAWCFAHKQWSSCTFVHLAKPFGPAPSTSTVRKWVSDTVRWSKNTQIEAYWDLEGVIPNQMYETTMNAL